MTALTRLALSEFYAQAIDWVCMAGGFGSRLHWWLLGKLEALR